MEKSKEIYIVPIINKIVIDNEISLALESEPPAGPNEGMNIRHQYSNEPFGQHLV